MSTIERRRGRAQARPRALFAVVLLLVLENAALAHEPGVSALDMTLDGDRLDLRLGLARSDWEKIEAGGAVAIRVDGHSLTPVATEVRAEEGDSLRVDMSFQIAGGSSLEVDARALSRLPWGHRLLTTYRDGRRGVEVAAVLGAGQFTLDVSLANVESESSFVPFLGLGIDHILRGYDHLLFLLALLSVVPNLAEAFRIVTGFTLAHSLTLVLASYGHLGLPADWVEPLIAASIVYVGLENLFRERPRHRFVTSFAFGLVHGMGFASALEELGATRLSSLFGFNLGVELGQLAVAGALLPLFWWLVARWSRGSRPVTIAGSALVSTIGIFWLVARLS